MEEKRTRTGKTREQRELEYKNLKCYFCETKSDPDYKDTLVLRRYISERGKIQPGGRTGTCSKHQRMLSSEIKKARQMALIYYTENHAL